jgi:CheY-like chemotaxis protein
VEITEIHAVRSAWRGAAVGHCRSAIRWLSDIFASIERTHEKEQFFRYKHSEICRPHVQAKQGDVVLESAALILVAEDEQVIRDLLSVALEDDGYEVMLAESGEEAVALLAKHKNARGLITDVRLGGNREMTGWDVARHARELNPGIAVVYISGDSGADWSAQGVPKSVMVVKPFAMSQISTAIASLLNEAG